MFRNSIDMMSFIWITLKKKIFIMNSFRHILPMSSEEIFIEKVSSEVYLFLCDWVWALYKFSFSNFFRFTWCRTLFYRGECYDQVEFRKVQMISFHTEYSLVIILTGVRSAPSAPESVLYRFYELCSTYL